MKHPDQTRMNLNSKNEDQGISDSLRNILNTLSTPSEKARIKSLEPLKHFKKTIRKNNKRKFHSDGIFLTNFNEKINLVDIGTLTEKRDDNDLNNRNIEKTLHNNEESIDYNYPLTERSKGSPRDLNKVIESNKITRAINTKSKYNLINKNRKEEVNSMDFVIKHFLRNPSKASKINSMQFNLKLDQNINIIDLPKIGNKYENFNNMF
jgi:hypothetical protein